MSKVTKPRRIVLDDEDAFGIGGSVFICLPFTASSHPYEPAKFVAEGLAAASATRHFAVVLSHLAVAGIHELDPRLYRVHRVRHHDARV